MVYKRDRGRQSENQKQPLEIKNVITVIGGSAKSLENKVEKSSRNWKKMIKKHTRGMNPIPNLSQFLEEKKKTRKCRGRYYQRNNKINLPRTEG